MGLQTWRRFHGELTANVIAKAPHSYTVVVWHEPSGVIRQLPRAFARLESAKAALGGHPKPAIDRRLKTVHSG